MGVPRDWNDLDHAIFAVQKTRAYMPELLRQLVSSELIALVPYHPEVEGAQLKIENGVPFPFSILKDKDGEVVPLFTSIERMEEGFRKGKVRENTYLPADINGREIFEILGVMKMRAVINKSCSTGELTLNDALMRDLADGSALRPGSGPAETKNLTITTIDPADYPSHLVQAAFEKMKKHSAFRTAWIFTPGGTEDAQRNKQDYVLLVLMNPTNEQLRHELTLVVQLAAKPGDQFTIMALDEKNEAYVRDFFKRFPTTFYTAAGFDPRNPTTS